MANIFLSSIPFEDALNRLEQSPDWSLEKINDDPTYRAAFRHGEECRIYRGHSGLLLLENNPDFYTVLELQVSIGSRVLIDLGSLSDGGELPWWRLYGCREVDYAAELTKSVDRWDREGGKDEAQPHEGSDGDESPQSSVPDDAFLEELQSG